MITTIIQSEALMRNKAAQTKKLSITNALCTEIYGEKENLPRTLKLKKIQYNCDSIRPAWPQNLKNQ